MAALTTLGIVVALVAGNVAAVLGASQSPHIALAGQIGIYVALLLGDMYLVACIVTWWRDEQRGWH